VRFKGSPLKFDYERLFLCYNCKASKEERSRGRTKNSLEGPYLSRLLLMQINSKTWLK
jgi:hypothetical protein